VQEVVMLKIVQKLEEEFPGTPIVVGGDFNVDLRTSHELVHFKKRMAEAFSNSPRAIGHHQRSTHFMPFPNNLKTAQVDSFFVSQKMVPRIYDIRVGDLRDCENALLPVPRDFEERNFVHPSDHRPVILDLYNL